MKKYKFVFGVLLVLAIMLVPTVALAAPAHVLLMQDEQPPVTPLQLPAEFKVLIAAGVGYLVTQGLKSLSKTLGTDISGFASVIAASLVTSIVYFLTALLAAVPPTAQPMVTMILMLLLSVLSAFGVHATIKGFQAK